MKKCAFALVLILINFSVTLAQNDKKDSKTKDAIRKVLNEQVEAWNRGDLRGFMRGYWKSEKMLFISGKNMFRGWQSAFDRYKRSYDTKEKMGILSFTKVEIELLGKEAALAIGRFILSRKNDEPTGIFTLTFRKIGKKWRIVVDHTS